MTRTDSKRVGSAVAVAEPRRLRKNRRRTLDGERARRDIPGMDTPFWKTTPLEAMTEAQWESLCDGCGKCCLAKLEDEDTGEIHWTSVGCRLFDAHLCACSDYANRLARVSDCVKLTPANVRTIVWLPSTCGYRLVAEGRDLADWHPLVSGSRETVHRAGISVRGRITASEDDLADVDEYLDHMLDEEL